MSFDAGDDSGFGMATRRGPPPTSGARAGGYQVEEQDREFLTKYQAIDSMLFKISGNVTNLSKMVDKYGTKYDGHDLRQQFQQLQTTTLNALKTAEQNVKSLKVSNSKQRVQQDQLSRRLQGLLQQFQTLCQSAMQKDKLSIAQDRERAASFRRADDDDERENASLMDSHRREQEQRRQEQEQMHAQMQFNQSMIIEREEGMKEIESTMLEINEIFRDLSMAVHEQGGMLDNIEANMTSADAHVESGTGQLVKASDYQKKARNKMMCLLVIVAIVAAILVIVLVTQLK